MNLFAQGMRRALAGLHEITIADGTEKLARHQLGSPDVAECREFAAAAGFKKLGVVKERVRFGFVDRVEEIWVHGAEPAFLALGASGYRFLTRVEPFTVVTCARRGSGTFAKNFEAHLEAVSLTGERPRRHETLDDYAAILRAYERDEVAFAPLAATTLAALATVASVPAVVVSFAVFGPVLPRFAYVLTLGLTPVYLASKQLTASTAKESYGSWHADPLGVSLAEAATVIETRRAKRAAKRGESAAMLARLVAGPPRVAA